MSDNFEYQYESYQSFNWFDQFPDFVVNLTDYIQNNSDGFDFTLSNVQPVVTTLKNLFERSDILVDFKNSSGAFTEYLIEEGDRPDIVAYNFYNDVSLWWVIMLVNNIKDPINEWPLTQEQINTIVEYLVSYENKFSKIAYQRIMEDWNEKKRLILLPTKNTLNEIISLYRKNLL